MISNIKTSTIEDSNLEANNKSIQWLVVTDLDGTLLNHHTYDTGKTVNTIAELHKKSIPVILNTSKTYAETLSIRSLLNITDPFIVENGSALYIPKTTFEQPKDAVSRDDYWEIVLGSRKQTIDNVLKNIPGLEPQAIRLSQCSVKQAMQLTNLKQEQAAQAIAREFSEPLIWQSSPESLTSFQDELAGYGLTTIQGGRFLHVTGECDKGAAIHCLSNLYKSIVKTIVLGDSANDASMLAQANISVIVKSPSNSQLEKLITPTLYSQHPAPQGWCEAVEESLMRLKTY